MKKTVLLFAAIFTISALAGAETKVDINGSFEKCAPNAKGLLLPVGWVMNKISKGVTYSATTEEHRSGKFAFYAEAADNAQAYIYYYNAPIKAEAGDTLTFTVYAKGEGNVKLGVTVYSNEGSKQRFLRSLTAKGAGKISDGENWQKFVCSLVINKQKRYGKEFTEFQLRPTIVISGAGEFVLDDLSYELKKKAGK